MTSQPEHKREGTTTMQFLPTHIKSLKKYALDHYDDGGDVPTESWSDSNYAELLTKSADYNAAWDMLRTLMSVWHDRQCHAINSAF